MDLRRDMLAVLSIASLVFACGGPTSGSPAAAPSSAAARPCPPQPAEPDVPSHASMKNTAVVTNLTITYRNKINIKFAFGSGVVSRGGELILDDCASRLPHAREQLAAIQRLLASRPHLVDRCQVPGWFYLYLSPDVTREEEAVLLQQLNALELVDIAYAAPRGEVDSTDVLPWPPLDRVREHDHRTSPPPVKKK